MDRRLEHGVGPHHVADLRARLLVVEVAHGFGLFFENLLAELGRGHHEGLTSARRLLEVVDEAVGDGLLMLRDGFLGTDRDHHHPGLLFGNGGRHLGGQVGHDLVQGFRIFRGHGSGGLGIVGLGGAVTLRCRVAPFR